MHIALEVSFGQTAIAVKGAVFIIKPQRRTTAALQRVLEPVIKRVGEGDIARVLELVVDPVPAARVATINPHH